MAAGDAADDGRDAAPPAPATAARAAPAAPAAVLEARGITLRFGGLTALNDVSLHVAAGEIVALIGPNGAGKTSLFNVVSGLYRPQAGEVRIAGRAPVRAPGWGSVAAAAGAAAVGAGLAWAAVAAAPAWDAAINAHFRWQQAFPWGAAIAAGAAVAAQPAHLAAAGIGAVAGAAGAAAIRWRARRGPEVATACGLARTFQNIRLFRRLSARENVLVAVETAAGRRRPLAVAGRLLGLPGARRQAAADRAAADALLAEVGLAGIADRPAGDLPYGHQRRLEIARALALRPAALLLDEPAAGMNPSESRDLLGLIRGIRDRRGLGILLIEHDMEVVMGLSDRVVVLDFGTCIASGAPAEVRRHPAVIAAYLGPGHAG